ncbi:MAG: hypothetical protein COX62_07445 [Deltaproteobacteria bacterium CG_4_10_14_0_2_um_filter_43_8]|nr:MAG: hypothetical protein COV43_06190 [Deltaproteobacteria bacterium CG11_big_fil_rev_8_21_14_0_20_42_23]PJA19046.1 MAG: hypothetical protein COX62_07445 [Deltaproteobacteria bacterium CG_4_10_14_0_2_um_filter_43_8]PJC65182.1 MAG: hypothetical protein CO021_00585 [Deltaproteobacteria bacterium CG_4_9_14_0_2_um_filter_42_21]
MKKHTTTKPETSEFLLYQTEDGLTKLEVTLLDETVWLTQTQMADLFQKDVRTISEHISNIYEENELTSKATLRNFRTVQTEGNREVTRDVRHYNLDVIKVCGEDFISRDAGLKIRKLILKHWDEKGIELKFSGKSISSVSFFDEAIGLLIKRDGKSPEELKQKLKFPDILPNDKRLLNHTVLARVRELEAKES